MDQTTQPIKKPSLLSAPITTAVLLLAAHALNDGYNSFYSALMPVLMKQFGFTLTLGGLLASVASLATSLFQPVFGYMLDKSQYPPSIFIWPIITSIAICAIGIVPSVGFMIPLLIIAGLSTAAFHPHASSRVPVGTEAGGTAMALFISGGTIGYGLMPVIALSLVQARGLESLVFLAIPTVITSLILMRFLPRVRKTKAEAMGTKKLTLAPGGMKILVKIFAISSLRSTVETAFTTFMAVLLKLKGMPLVTIGVAILVFTWLGACGSLMGGYLSDRIGKKTTIVLGILGVLPANLLLINASGSAIWAYICLAGFFSSFFNPVTVVMAQDLMPGNRGMASGVIMGLGWSAGSLLVGVVGAVADRIGLVTTLNWVNILCIPALFVAIALPGQYFRRDVKPVQA
jgi:MFS transporter, FSR family, fosmidomycin resistance protein